MHYFIFPNKDSYITTEFQQKNFGSDEILEVHVQVSFLSTTCDNCHNFLIFENIANIFILVCMTSPL